MNGGEGSMNHGLNC